MPERRVPGRVRAAVEMLQIAPDDELLEIGCGPGAAVALACERLRDGRIMAIDRFAVAIKRASERNAEHVASGKARFQHVELAGLRPLERGVDKAFAVNVNLFWVRAADAELAMIKAGLKAGGILSLFYEAPADGKESRVANSVAETLSGAASRTCRRARCPARRGSPALGGLRLECPDRAPRLALRSLSHRGAPRP